MRIDILCNPKTNEHCGEVMHNVTEALSKTGVVAEVHLHHDVHKMIDHRVYVTPALVLDDTVRVAGRVPEVREIISFFAESPRYHDRMKKVA